MVKHFLAGSFMDIQPTLIYRFLRKLLVWYSHLFKNFPKFVVIHTVKGFSVNQWNRKMFFWNSLAFSIIQWLLAIWSQVPLLLWNPAFTSGSSWFVYCWGLAWKILSITLLECEMSAIVWSFEHFWHYPSLGLEWKLIFPVLWPLLSFPNLLAYWEQHFNSIIF